MQHRPASQRTSRSRRSGRDAFSLLELLVALTILVCSLATIGQALWGARDHYLRADLDLVGRLVAECIMEQVQQRWDLMDGRCFEMSTPPGEITERMLTGAWRRPFEALAVPRRRLISRGEPDPLFDPRTGPLLPPTGARSVADFPWEDMSYEVRVSFEVETERRTAPVPLDADGDGVAERDLARLEVLVHLESPAGGSRVIGRLTSILTQPDRHPGTNPPPPPAPPSPAP